MFVAEFRKMGQPEHACFVKFTVKVYMPTVTDHQ